MRIGDEGRDHVLEIVHVDAAVDGVDGAVCGYVALDCRTGARDDREPDHRRHEVAFRACGADAAGAGLAFTVVVGAVFPRRYRFELFLVDGAWVGVVDVAWDREGAVERRAGVHAKRRGA